MEASAGVTLRSGHIHDEEEHKGAEEHTEEEEHGHDHGQFDPHVWLSPVNAKKEMENIKNAYVKADPENKDYYEKNYQTYTCLLYTSILDLRNPTRSDGDNILGMVNKYMDLYLENPENLANKAKAEKLSLIHI